VARLFAELVAIDAANPGAAVAQMKAAITAFAPTDYLGALRGLLADGARLRMAEASAQRQAQLQAALAPGRPPLPPMPPPPAAGHTPGAVWRASSPSQDGSDRPGFWTRVEDVGVASVRQCRDSGYGPPSWTAALNGSIHTDGNGRPYFYPDCEAAQAAILDAAQVPDA
jgi:hypothetical protein